MSRLDYQDYHHTNFWSRKMINWKFVSWCWPEFQAEKSLIIQRFHSCVARFIFETCICKTKGFFVEWILWTCLNTRLRSSHHWVLTTLVSFTNGHQSYCCKDQKNGGYNEKTLDGCDTYRDWCVCNDVTNSWLDHKLPLAGF